MSRTRFLIASALLLAACGSDGADQVSAENPWARPTAPGATNAAFYVELNNDSDSDDQLVGASSPRCGVTEIHSTTMTDGVMSMAPAAATALTIPAGESLRLEPGGIHVMCMQVSESFVEGEEVKLVLTFLGADPMELTAPVEQR